MSKKGFFINQSKMSNNKYPLRERPQDSTDISGNPKSDFSFETQPHYDTQPLDGFPSSKVNAIIPRPFRKTPYPKFSSATEHYYLFDGNGRRFCIKCEQYEEALVCCQGSVKEAEAAVEAAQARLRAALARRQYSEEVDDPEVKQEEKK
jgi:hypothetical protein